MPLNQTIAAVTHKIAERSRDSRAGYLERIETARGPRAAPGEPCRCGNLAHGFAACAADDKADLKADAKANIAIVSAYNDMLSAHQPLERFPEVIKEAAREAGAVAQFAGGVPAMCDGVTQGQVGMELSLVSRDVIAMATAVSLSHDMFDGALMLGRVRQDRPGPADRRAGLRPPADHPRPCRADDHRPAQRREVAHSPALCRGQGRAQGAARGRDGLAIMARHLHLLRHRQLEPDAGRDHGPAPAGRLVRQPEHALRDALTRAAAKRVSEITSIGNELTPAGRVIDEKALVNGMVGLMATGGSTNHTMHLVAMARAAGIRINWDDFATVSAVTPLLARVYPNGLADVNQFHAAGGMQFLIRELLGGRPSARRRADRAGRGRARHLSGRALSGRRRPSLGAPAPRPACDATILRPVAEPFSADGGLKLLDGNLGRAVIKVSAVKPQHRVIEAPAMLFDSQEELMAPSRPASSTATSWPSSASRAPRPTACRSCTSSRRAWASCRTGAARWRWSRTAGCRALRARCRRPST